MIFEYRIINLRNYRYEAVISNNIDTDKLQADINSLAKSGWVVDKIALENDERSLQAFILLKREAK